VALQFRSRYSKELGPAQQACCNAEIEQESPRWSYGKSAPATKVVEGAQRAAWDRLSRQLMEPERSFGAWIAAAVRVRTSNFA